MPNYQKLYTLLFNAFTNAKEQLDMQNYGNARDILMNAQKEAEEFYLNEEEDRCI